MVVCLVSRGGRRGRQVTVPLALPDSRPSGTVLLYQSEEVGCRSLRAKPGRIFSRSLRR